MIKRYWWVFLVMLPVGAMAGLLLATVVSYVMPKMYESEAVIEVKPQRTIVSTLEPRPSGDSPTTPQFFATEFEKIKSRNSLEKVVESLELTNRWMVDKEHALRILKGMVTTQNLRGTDLISVRVRHTNQVDARDIAREVANAYRQYRLEIEGRAADAMLHELNKAVRNQEDKVEERRKVLATIVRTKGIVYQGSDRLNAEADDDSPREASHAIDELEREKIQLESQIRSLLEYDGERLLVYASGPDLPENTIRKLYPNYLEAKRELEKMRIDGLSENHPTVLTANDHITAMKLQLDGEVVKLRATLQAQLDTVADRLDEAAGERRAQSIKRSSLNVQDYVDAKREFETDQELLQMMKIKQVGETISRKIPSDTVMIHEEPVISDSPVSPNVTLNLMLGSAFGLLLSPLMALPVMWILNHSNPSTKRGEKPGGNPDEIPG